MLQVNFLYELGITENVKFYAMVKMVMSSGNSREKSVSLFQMPSDTVCF